MRTAEQHAYQAAVKRIMRRADRVSPEDWNLGRAWYPGERDWIGSEAAATGHDTDAACAAFAALSPRTQYGANRQALLDLLHGRPVGRVLPVQRSCAIMALADHTRLAEYLGAGPKVLAFAANLQGDPDPVTVDVWMMRMIGEAGDSPRSAKHYAFIQRCFQGAAGRLGEEPRALQAALWFDIRGDKPTDPNWRVA